MSTVAVEEVKKGPPRQYRFDRIRRGQVLAEGIRVTAHSVEEAREKAMRMRDGDERIEIDQTFKPGEL